MTVFERLETCGCEEVAFFSDSVSGLKSIIAIHDTTLGPAWGGTRLWDYQSEEEALTDVLRLAQGHDPQGIHIGGGCGRWQGSYYGTDRTEDPGTAQGAR